MKPNETFVHRISRIYPTDRAVNIAQQFDHDYASMWQREDMQNQGPANDAPDSEYYLVMQEPGKERQEIPLGVGEYLVGRDFTLCQIVPDTMYISRVHCLISVHTDGYVTLRDLDSKNGTFVNGRRLVREERCVLSTHEPVDCYPVCFWLVRK